jgi:hypothetical protein
MRDRTTGAWGDFRDQGDADIVGGKENGRE